MHISEDQPGLFQEPAKQSRVLHTPDSFNGNRMRIKNYVLDTNVLLHDPHSVYRFADNHVWIPIDVLSELDNFKNEQTERGANARTVLAPPRAPLPATESARDRVDRTRKAGAAEQIDALVSTGIR